jgi:hypothetical protein
VINMIKRNTLCFGAKIATLNTFVCNSWALFYLSRPSWMLRSSGLWCRVVTVPRCLCIHFTLGFDSGGGGAGNFSLHHRLQNGSGANPASYPMGTRGSFPGGKAVGAWSWPLTSI